MKEQIPLVIPRNSALIPDIPVEIDEFPQFAEFFNKNASADLKNYGHVTVQFHRPGEKSSGGTMHHAWVKVSFALNEECEGLGSDKKQALQDEARHVLCLYDTQRI